jgi:NADPH2:quinone reductase
MPFAVRIHATGGPEVLRYEELAVGAPGPGEARIRQHACGLNFIDVYHRTGLYPLPLPSGIGLEGSGVVEAYAGGPPGGYASERLIPSHRLVRLPEGIEFNTGAAMMLQGLTAAYLLRKTYRVQPGDAVLIHAAAGGVGTIACQWAKALGATVIGTVSNDAKAALAKAHGCDHVILYSREDVAKRVREITGGEGVAVVYDGVGKDTFMGSLDSLRIRGTMVSFGNASGPVAPFDPLLLSAKGSIFITRPTLAHYTTKRPELEELAGELTDRVSSGQVRIEVSKTYPLKDAALAQQDLEARRTTGSVVLLP